MGYVLVFLLAYLLGSNASDSSSEVGVSVGQPPSVELVHFGWAVIAFVMTVFGILIGLKMVKIILKD